MCLLWRLSRRLSRRLAGTSLAPGQVFAVSWRTATESRRSDRVEEFVHPVPDAKWEMDGKWMEKSMDIIIYYQLVKCVNVLTSMI